MMIFLNFSLVFISAMLVAILDGVMEYIVVIEKKKEEAFFWSVIDWFITAILFYFILKSENFITYLLFGSAGFGFGNFIVVKILRRWKNIKRKIKTYMKKIYAKCVNSVIDVPSVYTRQRKAKK